MEKYICPRCGNSNPKYIGYINNKPYCRFCISLKGESAPPNIHHGGAVVLDLKYSLSKEQKEISDRVIDNFKNHIDTLINAICGAGKTELVYGVMAYALTNNMSVGFAVPRKDVVIELFSRIKSAFPSNKVVAVYGGSTSRLSADIVVLTTHQLFRYENYFDLLILDEIDAFPYKGNLLLYTMFKKAVRGNSVLMSATPSEEVLKEYQKPNREILELNVRFHRHKLPVPKIKIGYGIFKYILLIDICRNFIHKKKPFLVFTPTIEKCEEVYRRISIILPKGNYVHSKAVNRSEIIEGFKRRKYQYLVTTAVLERGVTIKDLQVVIFEANNSIYDEASLVQISGRVGRKFDAPDGEVIYVAEKTTFAMEKSIQTIRNKNKSLQGLLQSDKWKFVIFFN